MSMDSWIGLAGVAVGAVGALVSLLAAARARKRHLNVITAFAFGERPRTSGLAVRLVQAALGLLDQGDRDRYTEEWSADLADQHGGRRQLGFALGTFYSALHLSLRRATSLMRG